ncbi:MAG: DegT/DnrJ/EryC1/StrS family aminotransferase [Acidimicrobiales bacterium]
MTQPAILGGEPIFPERLPLVRPTLDDVPALARRIERILASGLLTNGATVRELEAATAERLQVEHVVAVASCTAGLMLTYHALGVGPGDRVVLPSFTFAASAHAVVWTGAQVDFCEVTAERGSLDVTDLEARLDTVGPVAAISATHVYGHPAEVDAIGRLAEARGIPVVYDAAHALGSVHAGKPVGGFGAAEVFSLSPTKVVVAGEGGLVATGDAALAESIRLGRDYGNPGDYDCRFPGLNARMSELHAAVAVASLGELDAHLSRRNELVDRFEAATRDIGGLRVIRPATGDRSTFKDLTLLIDADAFGIDAAGLQTGLAAEQIDSRRYYHPPIHRQAAYAERWSTRHPLPVSDDLADRVLSPPLWSHLGDDQLDRMVVAIRRIHDHAPAVSSMLTGTQVRTSTLGPW